MDAIQTKTYRGYTIELHVSEWAENPREWANLGTIVHWHRRYRLGEERLSHDQARRIDRNGGFYEWLEEDRGAEVILPLTFLDHGVQRIRVGSGAWRCDPGGWDSGTVGFIYASREDIMRAFDRERMSDKLRKTVEKCLRGEIKEFDHYLAGEVYGYVVRDPDGEQIDSCWGYFGDPDESGLYDAAKHAIDWEIKQQIDQHAELVKAWIELGVPHIYRSPLELPYGVSGSA